MGQAGRLACIDLSSLRKFDLLAATEVLAGEGLLRLQKLRISPLEHDLPAGRAVAGAEVHDLVCRADHAGLVLDHHDRVARIAQLLEQADQPFGVARMQAHARFVQDKERIHQPGAQAGGEIHALGFAAGERARRAVQREIAQADLVEITEPRADFVQDQAEGVVRSQAVPFGERLDERQGIADWELVEIGQRQRAVPGRFSQCILAAHFGLRIRPSFGLRPSAFGFPFSHRYSRASGWKRLPPQSGQGV